MPQLVLLRHGESLWNMENRFTGWTDIALSEKGIQEAHAAGKKLKEQHVFCDVAFTSYLTRAIHTLHIVLEELDALWIPEYKSWRLNERHYGDLQGMNKQEILEKVGEEQFKKWRRSYDVPPPPMTEKDPRFAGKDPRYAALELSEIPLTESLQDTSKRALPYFQETIIPYLQDGKNVLVAAHGNSLRAIVKHLEQVSDADIPNVEIPTGIPYVYDVAQDGTMISKQILS